MREIKKRARLRRKKFEVGPEMSNMGSIVSMNNTQQNAGRVNEELEFTLETEDRFVSVKDCNKCPGDSGCLSNVYHSSGNRICGCIHFKPLPLMKNSTCPRNTVSSSSSAEWQANHTNLTNPIPVQISADHDASVNAAYFTFTSITVAAIVSSIFLVMLVMIWIMKRRALNSAFKKSCKNKMEMLDVHQRSDLLLPTDRFVSNPTYESQTCVDLAIPVFSPNAVNLTTQIGQGCFGKVFKGVINGELVAIKVVKKEFSDEAIKEVETMATFSHPNILHLIGIVRSSDIDAPWLVFEFMNHGDLASVLRNDDYKCPFKDGNSPQTHADTLDDGNLQLTNESLLDFAAQIAEGLKYLSSQHFVHRDIAARNCLVSANGIVKISDFGLSRDVYTCDYYKIGGSRLLPLRWMAPESILYGRFTLESDVWAYGVLLWEIFSWGKQPYFGHSNEEVVQLILDGVLLCPPSDCPTIIIRIMEGCWKTDPKHRLLFPQITQRISVKEFSKHWDPNVSEKKEDLEEMNDGNPPRLSPFKKSFNPDPLMDTWTNSGYEVPRRDLFHKDYLHVV